MSIKRILVVDDDPLVRESIQLMLQCDELLIELVESGSEALLRYETGKYAVVLTDNRMAGMTGLQLAQAIKTRNPAQIIILFSGSPPLTPAPACDQVLLKPFSAVDLRKAVAGWVDKASV